MAAGACWRERQSRETVAAQEASEFRRTCLRQSRMRRIRGSTRGFTVALLDSGVGNHGAAMAASIFFRLSMEA